MFLHLLHISLFSSCLVYCVWGLLSAGWKVIVTLNCGICPLWVGLNQCLLKISSSGELAPVFWWIELDLVSLKGSVVSISELGGVDGVGVALGSLFANVNCCAPVLLKDQCGAFGFCGLLVFGWA